MNQSVTVLVATYNADWIKLRATLRSVLRQRDVDLQIVIADDGSTVRWDKEILELCRLYDFTNIHFSNLPENKGTVQNVYEGLKLVQGRYCKAISPGDCLYGENTLHDWISRMQEKNSKVSFSDAVYYSVDGQKEKSVRIHKDKKAPRNVWVFEKKSRRPLFVNYLLANDFILGAALLVETMLLREYLEQIVGKIRYAEDNIYRMMVFDGVKFMHYPEIAVWYEFGTGISTNGQSVWGKRLQDDIQACNQIILQRADTGERLKRRLIHFWNKQYPNAMTKKIMKCILFPDVVFYRICRKLNRKGIAVDDTSEIEMFLKNKTDDILNLE